MRSGASISLRRFYGKVTDFDLWSKPERHVHEHKGFLS